jgi:hypothetical protein
LVAQPVCICFYLCDHFSCSLVKFSICECQFVACLKATSQMQMCLLAVVLILSSYKSMHTMWMLNFVTCHFVNWQECKKSFEPQRVWKRLWTAPWIILWDAKRLHKQATIPSLTETASERDEQRDAKTTTGPVHKYHQNCTAVVLFTPLPPTCILQVNYLAVVVSLVTTNFFIFCYQHSWINLLCALCSSLTRHLQEKCKLKQVLGRSMMYNFWVALFSHTYPLTPCAQAGVLPTC